MVFLLYPSSLSRTHFVRVLCADLPGSAWVRRVAAGWVHRDVKPENILVREVSGTSEKGSGRLEAVLADLGSCRRAPSSPSVASGCEWPTAADPSGAVAQLAPCATGYIGTRWYRSPEVLLTDGRYGKPMDIWAAAAVGFEMVSGEPLFPGNDELSQITLIHDLLGMPCRDAAVLSLILPPATAAAAPGVSATSAVTSALKLSPKTLARVKRHELRRRKQARLAIAAAAARRCRAAGRINSGEGGDGGKGRGGGSGGRPRGGDGRSGDNNGDSSGLQHFAEFLSAGLEYFSTDRPTARQLLRSTFFDVTKCGLARHGGGLGNEFEAAAVEKGEIFYTGLDGVAALVTETQGAALCAKGRTLRQVHSDMQRQLQKTQQQEQQQEQQQQEQQQQQGKNKDRRYKQHKREQEQEREQRGGHKQRQREAKRGEGKRRVSRKPRPLECAGAGALGGRAADRGCAQQRCRSAPAGVGSQRHTAQNSNSQHLKKGRGRRVKFQRG